MHEGETPRAGAPTNVRVFRGRAEADRALAEAGASERNADATVQLARRNADAVVSEERHRSDRSVGSDTLPERATVVRERARADEVVRAERATMDATSDRERAAHRGILAALLLERDDTDKHLLTERARFDHSISSRDDFLAIVSHDLRNLLHVIMCSAELFEADAADSPEGRRTAHGAKRIQRYVARMDRLIGDLVDVGSIEAGKLAVTATPGDAADLVTEVVETFRAAAADKGIALEARSAAGPLIARFDRERMLQVLANLLANAIKFTPPGGHVGVSGERLGEDLCLSVSDTGPGLPEDMLEAIFERFSQVHQGDSRGLGLGLYISRQIVRAHGGRIWAESTLGRGSQFRVVLPAR